MAYNIFERWPWTSFQNLNLDWILRKMKEAVEKADNAAETASNASAEVSGYTEQINTANANAAAALETAQAADNVLILFSTADNKAVDYNRWAEGSSDYMTAGDIFTALTVDHKIPLFMDRQQYVYNLAGYESSGLSVTRFKFSRYGGNGRENIAWIDASGNITYTYEDHSGGEDGGSFVVTITRAQLTGNTTSDKTYADVEAAYNEGQAVICHVVDEINHFDYYTAKCEITTAANNGVFHWESLLFYDPSRIYTAFLREDGLTGIYVSYVLPSVSASDNGKFLRVVEGAWEAEDEYDAYSALPSDTASGEIASFPDGADDAPVKSLVAQIAPVQSGSGNPSPTNIRPISGFTGCKVSKVGKNLLPPFAQASATTQGVTLTNENGEYTLNGTATARTSFDILVNLPAGVYTLSANNDAIANGSVYVMSDANTVMENISLSSANKVQTFTVASRIERIRITVARDSVLTNVKLSPVITSGSTAATAYEPYQVDTYNIAFPSEAGTVYGGTLDVTNGVLTVTKGLIPSYNGEALPGEWISSMDVYAQGVTPTTGAQVCYDLTSPVTYQLDPVTIKTIHGVNKIWADTGDVAVDYRADTGLYIQKLLDASGKYFPSVTASDNGKFLRVVDGEWAAATVPTAEDTEFGP